MKDEFGNSLQRIGNSIVLNLAGEDRTRSVGRIDESQRVMVAYRSFDTHLHRKANAFGFNHMLLKTATKFDNVFLNTNKIDKYVIPVHYILSNGKFLFFKEKGFEKQIFVTVEEIQQFRIN